MTQEDKELLLKDLCARLPYGVIVKYKQKTLYPVGEYTVNVKADDDILQHRLKHLDFKPYLRPMSSMTEEEKEYIKRRFCYENWTDFNDFFNHYQIDVEDSYAFIDWLNAHHFDYRGLIEDGLAIDATGLNIY